MQRIADASVKAEEAATNAKNNNQVNKYELVSVDTGIFGDHNAQYCDCFRSMGQ